MVVRLIKVLSNADSLPAAAVIVKSDAKEEGALRAAGVSAACACQHKEVSKKLHVFPMMRHPVKHQRSAAQIQ